MISLLTATLLSAMGWPGNGVNVNGGKGCCWPNWIHSANVLQADVLVDSLGDLYSIDKYWGKIIKTADGYAMTAAPYYRNSAVLIKVNRALQVEFIKEYPDSVNLSNYFYLLTETPQGYLLFGTIQRPDYYGDGFIRYVDKQGETIWFQYLANSNYTNNILDVRTISDSLYVGVMFSEVKPYSPVKLGSGTTSIFYINLAGEKTRFWESKPEPEIGYLSKIVSADADGLLLFGVYPAAVVGTTRLLQPTLSKLDTNFQVQWVRHFGYIGSANADVEFRRIDRTVDGQYVGLGETIVGINDSSTTDAGWLYKFSPSGDSIWERAILPPVPVVYTNGGFFGGGGVLSSGSIVAGGSANDGNKLYCWLVKVSNDGCLDTLYCQSTAVGGPAGEIPVAELLLFPNPARGYCTLLTRAPVRQVRMFDFAGREIPVALEYPSGIRFSPGVKAGIYNLVVTDVLGRVGSCKVAVAGRGE